MRVEGKVRVAGCLRLELVGDAAAAVMDVAEAELERRPSDRVFMIANFHRSSIHRHNPPEQWAS